METANPIQIKVEEELFDENAGRTITLSSVGGTDLSVFPAGTTLEVKGSGKNDGSFFIQTSDVTHTLEIQQNSSTEEAGIGSRFMLTTPKATQMGIYYPTLRSFLALMKRFLCIWIT